jgi:hypothetical protein
MIRLRCVKENNKLRVKIISEGYSREANCQFPRDIRQEGREYLVPASDVKFSEMRCQFFYLIGKNNIQSAEVTDQALKGMKIYGDTEENKSCCICLMDQTTEANIKFIIFAPCGHYCCCTQCGHKVSDCPICRTRIQQRVTKDQLG